MKQLLILSLAAVGTVAFAQTDYTNADGTNDYISNALNWDNGLPGSGNPGTITINAGIDTDVVHENYGTVTHSAGQINRTNGLSGLNIGVGTDWIMSGTATATGVRGLSVNGGGSFTLDLDVNTAQANFTNNNRDTNVEGAGSTITINSGEFQTGRTFTSRSGGAIVMNGGSITFSASGNFGSQALSSGGSVTINAGNVTADRFSFKNGHTATFGSLGAGTLTFVDWGSGLYSGSGDRAQDTGIDIDFLAGSQIILDMSASARALDFTNNGDFGDFNTNAWAEALWETDRLFYNGQNSTDLGGLSWADASSSSVGLGGGEYFNFTAAGTYGGSLQLGTVVIPEPSSIALMGIAGLAMLAYSRKRRS